MNIQTLLANIITFLNTTVVPFLLVIAFIVFLWGITRYFIIEGSSAESQEKAKSLALWGIMSFAIIVSLWGIVNMIASGLDFGSNEAITPDYVKMKTGG